MPFKEDCWIIYGLKIKDSLYGIMIYESQGSLSSVDFDWEKVFNNRMKIIGFNHTHFQTFDIPSSIDDHTMTGWVKALGKPLLCGIKCDLGQKMYLYERSKKGIVNYREVKFTIGANFIKVSLNGFINT